MCHPQNGNIHSLSLLSSRLYTDGPLKEAEITVTGRYCKVLLLYFNTLEYHITYRYNLRLASIKGVASLFLSLPLKIYHSVYNS